MRCRRLLVSTALVGALLSPAWSQAVLAQQVPYWPTDQEKRLEEVETQLLDVQRKRFAALFGKDKKAAKELDTQFRELQKERRQLLRVTGQH